MQLGLLLIDTDKPTSIGSCQYSLQGQLVEFCFPFSFSIDGRRCLHCSTFLQLVCDYSFLG